MSKFDIVSADSHVIEPGNLWKTRLDKRWRHRAPQIVRDKEHPTKKAALVAEGIKPFPVAVSFANDNLEEPAEAVDSGYAGSWASGWDPAPRIKDQAFDGLDAEVIYPTLTMPLFAMTDGELQRACFHAYNEWLREYCDYAPKKLFGIGLISLEDIDKAVKDVDTLVKMGMRGAMVWCAAPEDKPFHLKLYDPFWRAASEAGLPVSMHCIASRGKVSAGVGGAKTGSLLPGVWYMSVIHEIQETLAALVFGGVFERFPQLKIVSVENDIGWLAHFIHRMDHAQNKFKDSWEFTIPRMPSEYLEKQFFATFQDDPVGTASHKVFGASNYMWASDFPHNDTTFPDSHAWIDRNFQGIDDSIRRAMVYDNVMSLYQLEL